MRNKILVILCLLAVLLTGCASAGQETQPATLPTAAPTQAVMAETVPETTAPSQAAPDFTVLNWEGSECKLSDYRGKPVILNFWASWCGPCRSEMPDFEEAYQACGDAVEFMVVNCTGGNETVETAKAFIEEQGYTFPVYFDTTYEASSLYGVNSIPMTFFIDAEGNAVAYGMGALDAETLRKGIDMIYSPEE